MPSAYKWQNMKFEETGAPRKPLINNVNGVKYEAEREMLLAINKS
jgi:hypothetical protein